MSEFFGPTGRKLLKRVGNTEEKQENFNIKNVATRTTKFLDKKKDNNMTAA
jgi:hypothetical protein